MAAQGRLLLDDPIVRQALRSAWLDSNPGIIGGHEEGGFIVRESSDKLAVVRWRRGGLNSIVVPVHGSCRIDGAEIVASFHTHPNIGPDFLQEPSETDIRAVTLDPDLKGATYLGELVVSNTRVYLIQLDGNVVEVADTAELFVDQ